MLSWEKQRNNLYAGMWYRLFLGCTFFICLTIGCKETQTPPEEAEVVRQKIVAQKETNEQPPETEKDLKGSGKDGVRNAQFPAKPLTNSESEVQQKEQASSPGHPSETVQEKMIPPVTQESQRPTSQSILEERQEKTTGSVSKKEEQSHESPVYSYNPVGKIDPFRPILSSRVGKGASGSKKTDKTAPLTPLQKIEIDQVKLVGIIVSSKGNKAMVEDASGKGYILTKGTYIGTNFGKVVKILKNKVIVHEEFEDYITGQIKSREVTLEPPQKYENGSIQ